MSFRHPVKPPCRGADPTLDRRRLLAAAAACGGVAALAGVGCAKPPPPPPPPTLLELDLRTAPELNPDLRGRPSPLVLRTYELKTRAAFDAADFFSLWDREKETLGAELVARDELVLQPGATGRRIERRAQEDTRVFAVVAAFRDIERARWRDAVAELPQQTHRLELQLAARELALRRL